MYELYNQISVFGVLAQYFSLYLLRSLDPCSLLFVKYLSTSLL